MATKIDLHLHTKGSDGIGTPREIAALAKLAKLDGICITDHHKTYTAESLEVAEACRSVGLQVFHGCEYSTAQGHLLIYGVDVADLGLGKYPQMQRVIDLAWEAGGAAVPAHPYQNYERNIGDGVVHLSRVRAFEAANGQLTYKKPEWNAAARAAARKAGRMTTGGSDAHNPRDIGLTWTRFDDDITNARQFIRALRQGTFQAVTDHKRATAEYDRRHGRSLDTQSRNVHPGVDGNANPDPSFAWTRDIWKH